MFTGIVEETGSVLSIRQGNRSMQWKIRARIIPGDLKIGDSVAVNGVCLTVTAFDEHCFSCDVMPQTMERTHLGQLTAGSRVNLERALKLSDRLGGHLVTGHIDGVGRILRQERDDNAIRITIGAADDLLRFILPRGSVTVDGISLTVSERWETAFQVSVIPHTWRQTNLPDQKPGAGVNLECDLIGKYVAELLSHRAGGASRGIGAAFLAQHGFA